ncbi:MAG TPA: ASPIC/UnbV domain-containing protein [Gemmataceae bacterium]|nr:ASPIC/UnbV domain-containing protein [Gemmataceae bacterium]
MRSRGIPPPGQLDPSLNEFWVSNPWETVEEGHNLSAYERGRTWLNVRGKDFLDISYLSGADDDGDGRCVVAGDFRNNGRLDVVVRKSGGGPLQLYENNFPQRHYLKVTLRGTRSNRQGIGARLVAVVNGQQLVREMYPQNSHRSQMPNIVHFGLGDHDHAERLTIRWPSGEEQVLTDVGGDRHIVVEEGKQGTAAIETVVPGQTIRP